MKGCFVHQHTSECVKLSLINDYGFLIWLYFPTETNAENEREVFGGGQREGIVKGGRGENGKQEMKYRKRGRK